MLGGRPRPAGGAASKGTLGDRAGGGCSSAHARPPAANFCGLRGGGSGCVGRRRPPPPGPHRATAAVCVCAAQPRWCSCSYAARSRPAHPGAAPAGKPSLVSLSRVPAAEDRGCCSCARARNVVTAGTRWRAGPGRRDERLASRENLERGRPFSFQRVGRWGQRGDFAGTDLRAGGGLRGMGAGNWGQCWRGLGWSAERAGRRTAVEAASPRAAGAAGAAQTCHPARPPPQARVPGRVLCSMALVLSFRAWVRLGPAYGGLVGVSRSPPHTLTLRGMGTSAAPPIQALK